jgi:hypothetical protein
MTATLTRRAHALTTFVSQLDAKFPDRSTASDGWIADQRHIQEAAAHPEHHPWDVTQHIPNADNVVCAIDVTHDPAHGVDCHVLMEQLDASNDPRIYYLIFDRMIDNSNDTRTAYTGVNPHTKHMHISTWPYRPDLYDNPKPWALPIFGYKPSRQNIGISEDDMRIFRDNETKGIYLVTPKGLTPLKNREEVDVAITTVRSTVVPFESNRRFHAVLREILARETE